MVDADVILEGVGASDVIVVRVFAAPDNAARLVLFAGHRLELCFDKTVFETCIVLNTDGVSRFARLLQDIGFAGCGIIRDDFPFGFALAGFGGGPAGRRRTGFEIVEGDGVGECCAGGKGAHERQDL